jgi:hypothetical protein
VPLVVHRKLHDDRRPLIRLIGQSWRIVAAAQVEQRQDERIQTIDGNAKRADGV